jgi:hypothetical protein
MRKRFHTKIRDAFAEASTWAGIAGPIGVLGTQVEGAWRTGCFVAAAVCGILAVILKGGSNADSA